MINVVLVEPEIPQNTGNIARTCACTGAVLHLVGPLGFDIDEKSVRRAGLDYWDKVTIFYYENLSDFLSKHGDKTKFYVSTKAKKFYSNVDFTDGDIYFLFGKESKGLPEPLIYQNYENAIKIPMTGSLRSLNLSNAAAIIIYEALRQRGFSFSK